MINSIEKINDELNNKFGNDNVIFTDNYSLIFREDAPSEDKIDEAIQTVKSFLGWWQPYYDKAHNITIEDFDKQLTNLKEKKLIHID